MANTYRDAGVDIEKGDRFAGFIQSFPSSAVDRGIGGFAGGFEVDVVAYKQPVVMTTTDGVGTKLIVAQKLSVFDTVGIDLVAMCVNDLIASGADPKSFLDYIACGRIDEQMLQDLIKGIVNGCEQAGCRLSGGETAEMPDMYQADDFDLAGFAVGVADKASLLPATDRISAGDLLLGLPSSGIHSNGFSLARKALPMDDTDILRELLIPTKIYVREIQSLIKSGSVNGVAHITGGGLEANIARILPNGLNPRLSFDWDVPGIFGEIEKHGGVNPEEMKRVFNLGIGMVVCVQPSQAATLQSQNKTIKMTEIGSVVRV